MTPHKRWHVAPDDDCEILESDGDRVGILESPILAAMVIAEHHARLDGEPYQTTGEWHISAENLICDASEEMVGWVYWPEFAGYIVDGHNAGLETPQ